MIFQPYQFNPQPNFKPCECCKHRYPEFTYSSSTSSGVHKFTRKEIAEQILDSARNLSRAPWYERGDIRRRIDHWFTKLQKYDEAREEFDFE